MADEDALSRWVLFETLSSFLLLRFAGLAVPADASVRYDSIFCRVRKRVFKILVGVEHTSMIRNVAPTVLHYIPC